MMSRQLSLSQVRLLKLQRSLTLRVLGTPFGHSSGVWNRTKDNPLDVVFRPDWEIPMRGSLRSCLAPRSQ
jgi:hypothetical protein